MGVGKHMLLAGERIENAYASAETQSGHRLPALSAEQNGGFTTGSDFLMDGGVTAAYWYDDVAEVRS